MTEEFSPPRPAPGCVWHAVPTRHGPGSLLCESPLHLSGLPVPPRDSSPPSPSDLLLFCLKTLVQLS